MLRGLFMYSYYRLAAFVNRYSASLFGDFVQILLFLFFFFLFFFFFFLNFLFLPGIFKDLFMDYTILAYGNDRQ